MSPQEYTKRDFLAISGGALATAAGMHIAGRFEGQGVADSEHAEVIAELKDPRDRIEYAKELFDTNPAFKEGGKTWRELANRPVSAVPDMKRHEYATHFFSETRGVDLEGNDQIPKPIRENLSRIVPGLLAQESKYDNSAVSSAKARTMWQIIPDFYRSKLKSGENFMDMTVSTRIAFQKFEDIYNKFQTGVKWRSIDVPGLDFDSFQDHFNLTDQQWENFLTMAMVNAYNAGERRMLEILNWFLKEYRLEDFAHASESTELDLFAMMTDLARKSGKFSRYGTHANNYVYFCMGGVESLSGELPLEFSELDLSDLETVSRTSNWAQERVKDTVLPVVGGTATGTVIHVGAGRFKKKKRPEKETKEGEEAPIESSEKKTSRVISLAKWVGASVTGAMSKIRKPKGEEEKAPVTSKPRKGPTRREVIKWGSLGTGLTVAGGAAVYYRNEIADAIGGAFEGGSLEGHYSLEEVDEEVARLRERGIRLYSSTEKFFENGRVDAPGRTAFVGMRKDVWATMEQLLEDLGLLDKGAKQIIITGMAEGADHSSRMHGHGKGYSVDFRTSSAGKIANALTKNTTILPPTIARASTSRKLEDGHPLLESGLVIGDKIFRYNSKYFLFGLEHRGHKFVCYFDSESTHRHMEMIPWDDYNTGSQSEFVKNAKLPSSMKGIWRQEVRDHIRANL